MKLLAQNDDPKQLIDRPDTRRGDFYQVPVRIPNVDALATQLPPALLFHRGFVLFQPRFPASEFGSRHRERNMKARHRRHAEMGLGAKHLKQHLAVAGLHSAATVSEIADNAKSEDPLVKPS